LPSGKLVLLGEAGTGKTSAAVLALTELITIRDSLDAEQKREFPIPVLLPAQEWPLGVRIQDWVADRLARDYREIIGREQAQQLVQRRRVAVIIDGFDEIGVAPSATAPGVHTMDKLQQQRAGLITALNRCEIRFVLISRPDVLMDTIRENNRKTVHLGRAVAVELRPTSTDDIVTYLRKVWPQTSGGRGHALDRLAEFLESEPNGSLTTVLRVPFYLSLFRDAYTSEQVLRLLDDPRAKDADDRWFKNLMLRQVIPNAYGADYLRQNERAEHTRPATTDYPEADAHRYLRFLAQQLENDQSLRWWRIGAWAPGWQRILTTTLVGTALSTVMVYLANVVAGLVGRDLPVHTGVGAVIGAVGGLAAGFASERRAPDSFQHERSSLTGRFFDRVNLAVGLAAALPVSIITGVNVNLQYGFTVAFPAALFAGLAVLAVAGFFSLGTVVASGRQQSDSTIKRLRGMFNPVVSLAVGLPISFVYLATFPLLYSVFVGLVFGIAFGLVDGMTQIQASSAIPSSPMTSWTRDRRKATAMGLGLGMAIGIATGIGEGIREAASTTLPLAVVVGAINAVVITVLAGTAVAVAMAEVWRTLLTFAQLRLRGRFPLRGMKFLNSAYQANILRVAGPVYQFRHASLLEYLARSEEAPSPTGE
jgi:hypothetical protein